MFPNNNMMNYGIQAYNPYEPRVNYQMPLQQNNYATQQANNFKVVDSIDVVKATDIPIDGNTYYFPKADGSMIFSKKWLSNGQTQILTYKPIFEQDTSILSNETEKTILGANSDVTKAFMERFDRIEKLLAPYSEEREVKNE